MASNITGRVFSAFLLLALLLLSYGNVEKAEARICSFPSELFRGLCFSSTNCANVCRNEFFRTGSCQGFRLRCICQKPCPSEN
ncbi:unnamed protein product [Victoria cruziana]